MTGLLGRRLGLEAREVRLLLIMGALAGILVGAYTIAKVLRDALFIGEFGALSLPYAYIAVALTTAAYVFLESRVAQRFPRVGARRFTQYAAIACSLAAAIALPRARHLTSGLFYLWTSSQAMMLLPHFWALALDVWNSRRARRLFPLLGGCGLLGGLAGGGLAAGSAKVLPQTGLIWLLPGLLLAVRLLTAAVEGRQARRPDAIPAASGDSGWNIIRRSRYIKVLALALVLSVVISTLVDFQFKIFVQKMYPEPHDLTRFLGTFQAALNAVSLLLQFGATGWILQRLGLGPSTGLQPGTVLLFGTWAALTTGGWAVVAMRWLQGVVALTLGKSSTEIYYAAIRPHERRRIKPALDTLIERWSDALVGLVLLVALRFLDVPVGMIVGATAAVAAVWLVVLYRLDRAYGRAFREALSRRSFDIDDVPESIRVPAARQAILEALDSGEERRVLLALRFCVHARDARTARAVRDCLHHPSPEVRAGAVTAMEGMRLRDPEGLVEGFVEAPHDGLRRAAIRYLLARGDDPIGFARRALGTRGRSAGGDARVESALQQDLLEALPDNPGIAEETLTRAWVEERINGGSREDALLAARALGLIDAAWTTAPLRSLLGHPDIEVRRLALQSAARRPRRALLESILPLLTVPELGPEALEAVIGVGAPAVPDLRALLDGARGERAQARAARALGGIGTPAARQALLALARGPDLRVRRLGLEGLARMRRDARRPILSRALVHRLFLREIREYRSCALPAAALADHDAPEVRLLADSWREAADAAITRAMLALACWYDPRPLAGVHRRLVSREPSDSVPALEYLGRVLPRGVFGAVSGVFERDTVAPAAAEPEPDRLAQWIRAAWESGDAWLRAVAVRASRRVPGFDRRHFQGDAGDPMVRAELELLAAPLPLSTEPRRC